MAITVSSTNTSNYNSICSQLAKLDYSYHSNQLVVGMFQEILQWLSRLDLQFYIKPMLQKDPFTQVLSQFR